MLITMLINDDIDNNIDANVDDNGEDNVDDNGEDNIDDNGDTQVWASVRAVLGYPEAEHTAVQQLCLTLRVVKGVPIVKY